MLVLCWPKLTLCCPMLTLCWPKVPLSCLYVGPMFTYVGLGNALPHSSDRNDGGGEGVTTGWGGCFSFGVQTSGEYISTMFGCI